MCKNDKHLKTKLFKIVKLFNIEMLLMLKDRSTARFIIYFMKIVVATTINLLKLGTSASVLNNDI